MSDDNLLSELTAVVQYRRKDGRQWITMAAFDIEGVADKYAESCSADNSPWEYRTVAINKP